MGELPKASIFSILYAGDFYLLPPLKTLTGLEKLCLGSDAGTLYNSCLDGVLPLLLGCVWDYQRWGRVYNWSMSDNKMTTNEYQNEHNLT